MTEKNKIEPGDWIRVSALFPGIWHVSRVLTGIKEFEWDPSRPIYKTNQTLLFCHRLVNDAWKRSFSYRCFDLSLAQPLAVDEIDRVKAFLLSDNKLQKAFEQYQEKQSRIDNLANISFGGLSKDEVKSFPAQCSAMLAERIQSGITLPEVKLLLQESGLDRHMQELPQQVTLQLSCVNHELQGDQFLYREYRTLNF